MPVGTAARGTRVDNGATGNVMDVFEGPAHASASK